MIVKALFTFGYVLFELYRLPGDALALLQAIHQTILVGWVSRAIIFRLRYHMRGPLQTRWSSGLKAPLQHPRFVLPCVAALPQALTLTGTGDLILHEGGLHIRPPPSIYPLSRAGSTNPPSPSNAWGTTIPPKALTVSGGSLEVRGGGAAVRSTRANSPALMVSVGPLEDTLGGNGIDGIGGGEGDESRFTYSGVALAVNVREPSPRGEEKGDESLLEGSCSG